MKTINLILLVMFLFTGCASMTTAEKDSKRSDLDLMAKTAIDGLVKQDADLQKQIDDSLGYAVANMKVTNWDLANEWVKGKYRKGWELS